jgi:hypothetical protein
MQEQVKAIEPVKTDPRVTYLERLAEEKKGPGAADRTRMLRAWGRFLRTVAQPRHMTARGYALQPTQTAGKWEYKMTGREHARRRALRQRQRASRRANRG